MQYCALQEQGHARTCKLHAHQAQCSVVQDDAADAKWFSVLELPALAFDHKLVVRTALQNLLRQDAVHGKGEPVCRLLSVVFWGTKRRQYSASSVQNCRCWVTGATAERTHEAVLEHACNFQSDQ